ncbi:HNH endonuclease signature motif containing protein [Pseudomonas sp. TUM22785]|uniref:HNH endonuclease signature motif containing protein n=1 Tax=Pseudomonas sp. TUM22785 TaxID=3019098 RepID=UPI0023069733|nr:HNH endonuclease signature motif containing protein [Pseudomonas sp. TUM22785]WCD83023.1 HNH endonuclease signature motif containing protein [Pseudomonas sp. TUM22785]
MNARTLNTLLQYGVTSDLATKANSAGLTVTKARSLSQKDMVSKFGLSAAEAKILSHCVRREPIDEQIVQLLLERSNFVCSMCKGQKGPSYIIHHIIEHEKTQDNTYNNLIVLCPVDHDLAHRGGLTLSLTESQLRTTKEKWEQQVEVENAQKAARLIQVNDDAIDYINVKRIEELCVRLFKEIPQTTLTANLRRTGTLGADGSFDQKYVQTNLSGGRYLFDYITHQEAEHYKQLMQEIATVTTFIDLDETANAGYAELKASEGCYAFFIGGVCAKGPDLPITASTPTILLHYSRRHLRIEWILDPIFMMSMSAITRIGGKNRYIIYCLVRTVDLQADKTNLVRASPLLIAQPNKWVNKTPAIAYERQYAEYIDDDSSDDGADDAQPDGAGDAVQ